MPLRQLNLSGQGTNVVPVKGVQMPPLLDQKPLQLDASGRLMMQPPPQPQVQAAPQPQPTNIGAAQPMVQGVPQTIPVNAVPSSNPRINEIRNILGNMTPEESRISEIQSIMGGQGVLPQGREQNTGLGYKVGEFAKEFGKSIIRPFATPFAGFVSGIQGLRGKDTEIQLPEWLGGARGSGDLSTQARITGGAALEAASLLPASKALIGLRQVGTTPLRQLAIQEAKYGAKVGLAGAAGYELGQSEDPTVGSVLGAGAMGAGLGAALGILAPTAGRVIQKYITKGNKIFNKSEQQLAQKYDDVLGTLKGVTDLDEGLQQRAVALGMRPMSTGEFLLREGLPIGSREVNGRLTFRTADATEALSGTLKELATAKKELLKVKPDNIFNLGNIKDRVISNIDQNLLAVDEARLIKLISNVFDEEIAKRGNVVNGEVLESIKRGLQAKGKYSLQARELPVDAGTAKIHRDAAGIVREALEEGYNDIAELRKLNYIESQYINAIDVLSYLNKRPVQGGAMSKDLAGITGAIIGGSSKLPLVGPWIGKEFAEAVRNKIIDPKRRTTRLVKQLSKRDFESYGEKSLKEFRGKTDDYKQTQKIIEQLLKPKFATPLLESAQAKQARMLAQGGEVAVSPKGVARVTPAVDRGDLRSLEQGYMGRPAPLDETAFAKEASVMADKEATEMAFNNFLKQAEIKEIKDIYAQTIKELDKNIDRDLLKAIKNHPYFKKEGALMDAMETAYVMDNGNTTRLATDKMMRAKLVGSGYKQVDSVDSMATQAGFDSPREFLESLLSMDRKRQRLNEGFKMLKRGKRPTGEAMGALAGIEPELDENGKPTGKFKFDVNKALLGFAGMTAAKKIAPKLTGKGDDVLYHGTASKIDKFDNALMRGGNQGKGIYLSNNPNIAKYHSFGAKDKVLEKELGRMPYASEKTAGVVLDVKVKPGANIKKLDYTPTAKEVDALKKQGFDGVDFVDEVILEEWNPKIHGEYPKKGSSRTTMIFDANNVEIEKTAQ